MHEEQTPTINLDERLRPFLTPVIKESIDRYLAKGWRPSRVHSLMKRVVARESRQIMEAVGAYLDQIVDPDRPIDLDGREGKP